MAKVLELIKKNIVIIICTFLILLALLVTTGINLWSINRLERNINSRPGMMMFNQRTGTRLRKPGQLPSTNNQKNPTSNPNNNSNNNSNTQNYDPINPAQGGPVN